MTVGPEHVFRVGGGGEKDDLAKSLAGKGTEESDIEYKYFRKNSPVNIEASQPDIP